MTPLEAHLKHTLQARLAVIDDTRKGLNRGFAPTTYELEILQQAYARAIAAFEPAQEPT